MKASITEENYLKAIYLLSDSNKKIANLDISDSLSINPATVTEMLKKLLEKKLIKYTRAEGASLTKNGRTLALRVIRKHRLWETFLVDKLNFTWDEVHDVAEQLEHIQSAKLLEQLDLFLGYPKYDPHGDPIPDIDGNLPIFNTFPLSEGEIGTEYILSGVSNHSPSFLKLLNKFSLALNKSIEIIEIQEFDNSMSVRLNNQETTVFSQEVCKNLLVVPR